MIGVAFAYTEVEQVIQQWEYVLSNFRADVLYCVGGPPPQSSVLSKAIRVDSARDLPPEPELIVLAPPHGFHVQGEIPLDLVEHPEDVIYWFGSDAKHQEAEPLAGRTQRRVFIPTDTQDEMFSFVAYAVVAWDRRQKGG